MNNTIDDNPLDGISYFEDLDGDGYGNPEVSSVLCEPNDLYILEDTDCDDNDALLLTQNNDQDCDGVLAFDNNNIPIDCDDSDETKGDITNDQDCDGVLAFDENGNQIDCNDDVAWMPLHGCAQVLLLVYWNGKYNIWRVSILPMGRKNLSMFIVI